MVCPADRSPSGQLQREQVAVIAAAKAGWRLELEQVLSPSPGHSSDPALGSGWPGWTIHSIEATPAGEVLELRRDRRLVLAEAPDEEIGGRHAGRRPQVAAMLGRDRSDR